MSLYWTPRTDDDYDHLVGFDVYTSDNQRIGSVNRVQHPSSSPDNVGEHYLLVKPGMLDRLFRDGKEVRLPERNVQAIHPSKNRINLTLAKDQLEVADIAASDSGKG